MFNVLNSGFCISPSTRLGRKRYKKLMIYKINKSFRLVLGTSCKILRLPPSCYLFILLWTYLSGPLQSSNRVRSLRLLFGIETVVGIGDSGIPSVTHCPVNETTESAPVGGRIGTLILRENPQLVRRPASARV